MLDGRWRPHPTLPGVQVRYFHGEGDQFHRETRQDPTAIIEANTRMRNDRGGDTPGGMRKIGTIPATEAFAWIKEWTAQGRLGPGHGNLTELLKEKLRDRDFSKLRATDKAF